MFLLLGGGGAERAGARELHRIWSVLVADRQPAYDYGPAATQALENERFLRALLNL